MKEEWAKNKKYRFKKDKIKYSQISYFDSLGWPKEVRGNTLGVNLVAKFKVKPISSTHIFFEINDTTFYKTPLISKSYLDLYLNEKHRWIKKRFDKLDHETKYILFRKINKVSSNKYKIQSFYLDQGNRDTTCFYRIYNADSSYKDSSSFETYAIKLYKLILGEMRRNVTLSIRTKEEYNQKLKNTSLELDGRLYKIEPMEQDSRPNINIHEELYDKVGNPIGYNFDCKMPDGTPCSPCGYNHEFISVFSYEYDSHGNFTTRYTNIKGKWVPDITRTYTYW